MDQLMGGGIPAGDVVRVSGPVGSGKTVLAAQFLAAGEAVGEPGVMVLFEEPPGMHSENVKQLGVEVERRVASGQLKVLYLPPYDLSPAEVLHCIQEAVAEVVARRVVLDSMSALETYLTPSFQEEFREALCRLTQMLVAAGITLLLTVESTENFMEMRVAPQHPISFIADDVILQRYIEVEGQLRRMLAVIKMRGSSHSSEFHAYEIVPGTGLVVREALQGYRGLLHGVPEWRHPGAPASP